MRRLTPDNLARICCTGWNEQATPYYELSRLTNSESTLTYLEPLTRSVLLSQKGHAYL